jgi:uncharacterized protein YcfL
MKKFTFFLLSLLLLISCSVEKRIKEYSYTEDWHCYNDKQYQVYQTRLGERYIIVLNKSQTKFKRKYIKL